MALAQLRRRLPRGLPGKIINQYCFELHHLNVIKHHRTWRRDMQRVIVEFVRVVATTCCAGCGDTVCVDFKTKRVPGNRPRRVFRVHGLEFWHNHLNQWRPTIVCWACFRRGVCPFFASWYTSEGGSWVWHGTRRGTWPCVMAVDETGRSYYYASLDRRGSSFPQAHHPMRRELG